MALGMNACSLNCFFGHGNVLAPFLFTNFRRLYECMSVAELNIRLRNLADHCLATHKGNLEQREKLMHEIKDIQKTVDQLLGELKDEVMKQIANNAKKFGDAEERLVQLQKLVLHIVLLFVSFLFFSFLFFFVVHNICAIIFRFSWVCVVVERKNVWNWNWHMKRLEVKMVLN